jgi:hypothetical protein
MLLYAVGTSTVSPMNIFSLGEFNEILERKATCRLRRKLPNGYVVTLSLASGQKLPEKTIFWYHSMRKTFRHCLKYLTIVRIRGRVGSNEMKSCVG